jgi:ribonuclease HI
MSTEQVFAYASGRFTTVQSTIDAEINACINTLEKLKIYYLDQKEITLRTDCQAILSFYNKTNSNKASRVRWLRFSDAITGTGVQIHIEHIDGKHNVLADALSRFVTMCVTATNEVQAQLIQATSTLMEGLLEDHSEVQMMLQYCQNRFHNKPFKQPSQQSNEVPFQQSNKKPFKQPNKAHEEKPFKQPNKVHEETIVISDD